MRVVRAADHVAMPWKNGGGETREIAVHPPGASLEDFGWRISMASVAADGPFSIFAGVDRTLGILEGEGMELAIGDAPAVLLTRESAPLPFPCDVPSSARLTGGPVLDLNVMTRRGRFRHAVSVLELSGAHEIAAPFALFCAHGQFSIRCGMETTTADAHDCVFPGDELRILIEGAARVYLIDIAAV